MRLIKMLKFKKVLLKNLSLFITIAMLGYHTYLYYGINLLAELPKIFLDG
jgi:hypothetical protein